MPSIEAFQAWQEGQNWRQRFEPKIGEVGWTPPSRPPVSSPSINWQYLREMSARADLKSGLDQGSAALSRMLASSSSTVSRAMPSPALVKAENLVLERARSWLRPTASWSPPARATIVSAESLAVLAQSASWSSPARAETLAVQRSRPSATDFGLGLGAAAYDDSISPTGIAWQIRNNLWPPEVKYDLEHRGPVAIIDWLLRRAAWFERSGMHQVADAYRSNVGLVRELWPRDFKSV